MKETMNNEDEVEVEDVKLAEVDGLRELCAEHRP